MKLSFGEYLRRSNTPAPGTGFDLPRGWHLREHKGQWAWLEYRGHSLVLPVNDVAEGLSADTIAKLAAVERWADYYWATRQPLNDVLSEYFVARRAVEAEARKDPRDDTPAGAYVARFHGGGQLIEVDREEYRLS